MPLPTALSTRPRINRVVPGETIKVFACLHLCSSEVLSRIECGEYLQNKEKHNSYLKLNKFVAKKRFINLN